MRISDWSSDVCSSDLDVVQYLLGGEQADVAADLHLAETGPAEGQVGLAEIDARRLQPARIAGAVRAAARRIVDRIDAGIHAEMRAHIPSALVDRKSTRLNSSH